MDERFCIAKVEKGVAVLTLNRPKALNAIDVLLQQQILTQLQQWEQDEGVRVVVIKSSQEKAFCAGGDIRQIAEYVKKGAQEKALSIFQHNYELPDYVARYKKPIVTIMNGITMGGGIGLGAFAPYRIVTERSILAMPEVMIGLTPDAGSSLLFQKAPGFTGLRAMLTGQRFDGKTAIQMGFADYQVDSSFIENLLDQMERADLDSLLLPFKKAYRFDPEFLQQVEAIYNASSVEEIMERLGQSDQDWAQADLATLSRACPFSLQITYRAWHLKLQSLQAVLQRDVTLIGHLIQRPDFLEGVRSVLIDKDHAPKWDHSPVSDSMIKSCFTSPDKSVKVV